MARVADVIRARPLRADYVRVLDTVTRAWADRHKVAIRYRAASGELTERVICPYFLEVSRSEPASYVIAYDDLLHGAQAIYNQNLETLELLMVASAWYLIVTSLLSINQFYLERHYAKGAAKQAQSLLEVWKRAFHWRRPVGV